MVLRWRRNSWDGYYLAYLRDDFAKYEREIFSGKRECPFKVKFWNKDGRIVSSTPIPLTQNGKPKRELFG